MPGKDALTRFGVSMPEELVERFDQLIEIQGYSNRSEAIRDLVRKELIQPSQINDDQWVAGTIVMVYDHHASDLTAFLTKLQHDYIGDIISTMHIHLNHEQCLEIVVVRGKYRDLYELHQKIRVQKGISYAELSVTHADHKDESSESDTTSGH